MNINKFAAESLGTFALVFFGAGTAAVGVGGLMGVALAHGLVLLTFAYLIGGLSGGHINPAVTFGAALSGKLAWKDAGGYWTAQLLGGTLGAILLRVILTGTTSRLGATILAEGISPWQGLVLEAVLTFFLVNAVLLAPREEKNLALGGVIVGLTLVFCILLGGPLTGASLNPARTFGPALLTGTLGQFWIYLLGPLGGAAAAAWAQGVLNPTN